MKWEGLLTDAQHRLGYGTTIDADFVYLWCGNKPFDNKAKLIATFPYDTVTIKEIRMALENYESVTGRTAKR